MNARTEQLEHEVIDESELTDVKQIGRARYGRVRDGREVILLPGSVDQTIYDRRPVSGQLLVTTFHRERGSDGRMVPTHGMVLCRVVPAGTIENAERAAAKAKAPPAPRPTDGLAAWRAGIAPTLVPFRSEGEHPALSILKKTPGDLITRGKTDVRSVAEMVAVLRTHGTSLAVSAAGDLIATSTALRPQDAELLSNPDARRLLAAWVAGKPLPCAWPHRGTAAEAVTIAIGGAPICDQHLRGES